jgi:hypothetical protein
VNGNGFKIDIISVCFYDQCGYLALRTRLPWFVRVGSGPGSGKKTDKSGSEFRHQKFYDSEGSKINCCMDANVQFISVFIAGVRIYLFRFVIQTKTGHNMDSFVGSISAFGFLCFYRAFSCKIMKSGEHKPYTCKCARACYWTCGYDRLRLVAVKPFTLGWSQRLLGIFCVTFQQYNV